MGLPYMPIRTGVVDWGSIDRQSYGSPMECLGFDHSQNNHSQIVSRLGRWHQTQAPTPYFNGLQLGFAPSDPFGGLDHRIYTRSLAGCVHFRPFFSESKRHGHQEVAHPGKGNISFR